jgi:putative ABC transport system ATP-binding protein
VEIMAIFQRLNRDLGITVIMITHEPDIAQYAKRDIHFKDGRVVEDRENSSPLIAKESEPLDSPA